MSPSWRDSLLLDVGAAGLRLRRRARGWRPAVTDDLAAPLAALDAEHVGEVLATLLSRLSGRATAAHVRLAGRWTRLTLFQGAAALRGAAERDMAAAHALRRVYGEQAAEWRVAQAPAGPDALLVAGIDAALQTQIDRTLAGAGATVQTLRPSFVGAFNHCRRWMDRPAWLVVAETDRAVLCHCDGRRLRSLRSHRLQQPLHEVLPRWIDQARLVDELDAPDARLVVAHDGEPGFDPARLPAGARTVALDEAAFG